MVHVGKRFHAMTDSRAALLLGHTSTYNMTEDCYKTKILPAAIHLKTGDGSSMSLLGNDTLHLTLLTSSFPIPLSYVVSYQTDILFSIDIMKRYSLSHSWDLDKQLFIQRESLFFTIPETVSSNIPLQ